MIIIIIAIVVNNSNNDNNNNNDIIISIIIIIMMIPSADEGALGQSSDYHRPPQGDLKRSIRIRIRKGDVTERRIRN